MSGIYNLPKITPNQERAVKVLAKNGFTARSISDLLRIRLDIVIPTVLRFFREG